MPKDRIRELLLAPDVLVVVQRSSVHPVEYAIVLLVERDGVLHTVRTFDNAHAPEEHYEHRYVGSEKQDPIVRRGPGQRGDERCRGQADRRLERYRS
jgi:hypothetical protein